MLPVETYTPDGSLLAEVTGSYDFQRVLSHFSCVVSGNRSTPVAQEDARGWACFDVASVDTLGVAFAANASRFGRACGGERVGDGLITVEDVLVGLMGHYQIEPYRVPLTTPTITAPLLPDVYRARCDSRTRAPVDACDAVSPRGGRRRAQSAEPWHELRVVDERPDGMWVRLSVLAPHRLVSANLYIRHLPGDVLIRRTGFGQRAPLLRPGMPTVLLDPNGTRTTAAMASDDYLTLSFDLFSNDPFGQPRLYVWTPRAELCLEQHSTLTRVSSADASFVLGARQCVSRSSPWPPPPPRARAPPPPSAAAAAADPPPSASAPPPPSALLPASPRHPPASSPVVPMALLIVVLVLASLCACGIFSGLSYSPARRQAAKVVNARRERRARRRSASEPRLLRPSSSDAPARPAARSASARRASERELRTDDERRARR